MKNHRAEWARRRRGSRAVETPPKPRSLDRRRRQFEPIALEEIPPVDLTGRRGNPMGNPWSGKP